MEIKDIIKGKKSELEVNMMSPLVWAYIGDAVYEMHIRTYLVNTTKLKPNKLHIESIKYVKAKAQSEISNKIYDNLTDEEKDIVRRTRNTENHHLPKNAELKDYMYATAFEGLIGYLFLTNRQERLDAILEMTIK